MNNIKNEETKYTETTIDQIPADKVGGYGTGHGSGLIVEDDMFEDIDTWTAELDPVYGNTPTLSYIENDVTIIINYEPSAEDPENSWLVKASTQDKDYTLVTGSLGECIAYLELNNLPTPDQDAKDRLDAIMPAVIPVQSTSESKIKMSDNVKEVEDDPTIGLAAPEPEKAKHTDITEPSMPKEIKVIKLDKKKAKNEACMAAPKNESPAHRYSIGDRVLYEGDKATIVDTKILGMGSFSKPYYNIEKDKEKGRMTHPAYEWELTLDASKKNESKVDMPKLKEEIQNAIKDYFEGDEEFLEYVHIDTRKDDYDRDILEVRAELDYDGMMKLANYLNKIVQKYDKDAYFDMDCPGIISAVFESSKKNEDRYEFKPYYRGKVGDEVEVAIGSGLDSEKRGKITEIYVNHNGKRWAKGKTPSGSEFDVPVSRLRLKVESSEKNEDNTSRKEVEDLWNAFYEENKETLIQKAKDLGYKLKEEDELFYEHPYSTWIERKYLTPDSLTNVVNISLSNPRLSDDNASEFLREEIVPAFKSFMEDHGYSARIAGFFDTLLEVVKGKIEFPEFPVSAKQLEQLETIETFMNDYNIPIEHKGEIGSFYKGMRPAVSGYLQDAIIPLYLVIGTYSKGRYIANFQISGTMSGDSDQEAIRKLEEALKERDFDATEIQAIIKWSRLRFKEVVGDSPEDAVKSLYEYLKGKLRKAIDLPENYEDFLNKIK